MGPILWIAIFVKFILFRYIDNNFGFDEEGNILWYEPYWCYYPTKQTKCSNCRENQNTGNEI